MGSSAPRTDGGSDRWSAETDVLVVGAGAAGLTAALVAACEGLDALVCEKSALIGGTTATSGGTIWIPGSSQSVRAGVPDSADAARRYLDRVIATPDDDGSRAAFLETGPHVLDYLEARTDVKFAAAIRHPDYIAQVEGGAVGGRALSPLPFDGRKLGTDFALIRPPLPEFMVLSGMMVGKDDIDALMAPFGSVRNALHVARILIRHALDRISFLRGTRLVMGNAMIARLLFSLRQRSVPLWLNARVENLIVERGRVIGAEIDTPIGRKRVRARRGVVLAGGGLSHDPAMREALFWKPVADTSAAFEGNTGDGLRMASAAGATHGQGHRSPAFWMPASFLRRKDGTTAVFPHVFLDRAKPGLIAVNASGRRFVNEADSYHDFVAAMYRAHADTPSIPAYLICDRDFIRRYGIGLVRPGERRLSRYEAAGYLTAGRTLSELAGKIGVDAAAFEATVQRHNQFAETGIDEELGKGASDLNRHNGDPRHGPNPCLGPIAQAPFYAVAVKPVDIGASVGIVTDKNARALRQDGMPIDGLYACGNDMDSIVRGTYPGPGITLGPAMVFAYRAVIDAEGRPPV